MFPFKEKLSDSLSRRTAVCALLLALLAGQALPWLSFGQRQDPGAIQATAIAAPGPETCHHHPEGCPRDCFCPKIHADADEAPSGSLAGAALGRCTERGGSTAPAPSAPCLIPAPIETVMPDRSRPLPSPAPQAIAPGFRPAPGKVPIA